MHPADIQAALKKSAYTQSAIAEQCSVHPMTVSHVVHGRSKSRKIARAISRATGIPVNALWPGAYQKRGSQ